MLGKVQPGERIVTLEVHGKPWSTEQLAAELERWRLDARNVNLMVGGREGWRLRSVHAASSAGRCRR